MKFAHKWFALYAHVRGAMFLVHDQRTRTLAREFPRGFSGPARKQFNYDHQGWTHTPDVMVLERGGGLALEVLTYRLRRHDTTISWEPIAVFYALMALLGQDTRSHSGLQTTEFSELIENRDSSKVDLQYLDILFATILGTVLNPRHS
jgi:hypothetical protein